VLSLPFETVTAKFTIPVMKPVELWDLKSPALYYVRAELKKGAAVLDSELIRVGFRTIRFDAEKGFFLNDKPVKIQGTCNHQDHACVGVAVPESVERFRIERLLEIGCNAYRTSHNPPSKSLLDICDEKGVLVMDENRHFNSSAMYLPQLEWLVKRDRNHPCVILWSLFNEESL